MDVDDKKVVEAEALIVTSETTRDKWVLVSG